MPSIMGRSRRRAEAKVNDKRLLMPEKEVPEGDWSMTRRRRDGRRVHAEVKYISVRHHLG
jgi:hypothetical protein